MSPIRSKGFVFAGLLVGCLIALLSPGAPAVAKTASYIVIDATTGQPLAEHNADVPGHPASLTKMMTLYLLFEEIEQGNVTLDQRFRISEKAAAQSPTKLGLIAGDTIAVRDLILGIITQSANDAAVVVAENLGGSEAAFAERMTKTARSLDMRLTFYRNASGLPDPGQITTARDLARLALALYRNFPREYPYFATEEFTYHGIPHANHNRLMRTFAGMDGIKTGYVRASGFNLAASAVRGGRRLIGIVMGGRSPYSRDMEMAALLNEAFASAPTEPTMVTAAARAPAAAPSLAAAPALAPAPVDALAAAPGAMITREELPEAPVLASLPPEPRAEARTPAHLHQRSAAARWGIQVGAFAQQGPAIRALAHALTKLAHPRGKVVQVLAPAHNDRYFRARIVNFTEHDAARACTVLHRQHLQCAVVHPTAAQQVAENLLHHRG